VFTKYEQQLKKENKNKIYSTDFTIVNKLLWSG